jgi:hypothetical protein
MLFPLCVSQGRLQIGYRFTKKRWGDKGIGGWGDKEIKRQEGRVK